MGPRRGHIFPGTKRFDQAVRGGRPFFLKETEMTGEQLDRLSQLADRVSELRGYL
jgi:hypothetical protein